MSETSVGSSSGAERLKRMLIKIDEGAPIYFPRNEEEFRKILSKLQYLPEPVRKVYLSTLECRGLSNLVKYGKSRVYEFFERTE